MNKQRGKEERQKTDSKIQKTKWWLSKGRWEHGSSEVDKED